MTSRQSKANTNTDQLPFMPRNKVSTCKWALLTYWLWPTGL